MSAPLPSQALFNNNQVLVKNLTPSAAERATALGYKVETAQTFSNLGLSLTKLIVPEGSNAVAAQQALGVEFQPANVALNRVYRPWRAATGVKTETPAIAAPRCEGDRCYGLTAIRWQPQLATCAQGLNVGVIDTDFDDHHPAFANRSLKIGRVEASSSKSAAKTHGTGILAILAGDPRSNTPGLIPDANFYVFDIFAADETGQPVADTMSLLKALEWMKASQVKVINMSLSGPRDELIEKAIVRMSAEGTIFIAAAGNGGPTGSASYPAAYAPVVAVTAVNKDMRSYRYANHGTYIDVAAPGVEIFTAAPGNRHSLQSGTSFAVPYVTSVIASIYRTSAKKDKQTLLRHLEFLDLGSPGKDNVYGHGLIQAPESCKPAVQAAPLLTRPILPDNLKTASQ